MWRMKEPNGHADKWAGGHILDVPQSGRPLTLDDVRKRLFQLIDATPSLDWLLLTKRPENIRRMWRSFDWQTPSDVPFRQNVWLGTSVENQEYADSRVPKLLDCRQLASVLFLSCEPLVGPVDLTMVATNPPYEGIDALGGQCFDYVAQETRGNAKLDWIITGGESGQDARPCDPQWFRSLRDQCEAAGTPFHFKQWGEFDSGQERIGKKNAGRLLDGRTHDGLPLIAVGV